MDNLLLDTIQQLRTKIIAAGESGATPEELAYLASALEKISGKATLYEVIQVATAEREALALQGTTLNSQLAATIDAALDSFINNVNTHVEQMTHSAETLKETHLAEVTESVAQLTDTVEDLVSTAEARVIAATESLGDAAAIAQQQALNGSLFINHFFSTMR